MNFRRLNDVLKVVGAFVGALALFGPVLQTPHPNVAALIGDILGKLPAALAIYAAGIGTRALGTEYQDVADAKAIAKASMMPPPMPPMTQAPPPPSAAVTPTQGNP